MSQHELYALQKRVHMDAEANVSKQKQTDVRVFSSLQGSTTVIQKHTNTNGIYSGTVKTEDVTGP